MKNVRRVFALCLALSMVLSVAVFAGEKGAPGTISEIKVEADYADSVEAEVIETGSGAYESFELTYSDATNGGMYLILVLSEEGTPKDGNILYVNQVTADEDGAYFENVYPTELGEENSYIYIAGPEGYKLLGEIIPNVVVGMKGDVDLSGFVDMDDVIELLRHVAEMTEITDEVALDNGEVTGDTELDMDDVIKLLRYVAEMIPSLD